MERFSDNLLRRIRNNDSTLTQLDISNNNFGDEGAQHLADALKINTSLQHLSISWNKIGDDGARHLADALKINTSLQHLDISKNNIGDDGARHLADALKTNTSIQEMNISKNKIGDGGARHLADTLKINLNIRKIVLDRPLQQTVSSLLERNNTISLIGKYIFDILSSKDQSFVDAIAQQLRSRSDAQKLLNSTNTEGKTLHQEALRLGQHSIASCLNGTLKHDKSNPNQAANEIHPTFKQSTASPVSFSSLLPKPQNPRPQTFTKPPQPVKLSPPRRQRSHSSIDSSTTESPKLPPSMSSHLASSQTSTLSTIGFSYGQKPSSESVRKPPPPPIKSSLRSSQVSQSPDGLKLDAKLPLSIPQSIPQQMINGFELIKELGVGKFGKVHLVQRQFTSPIKQFAMKVIPCGNDDTKFNMILNELTSTAKLVSPTIVEVEQCFTANIPTKLGSNSGDETLERHACIVMEYCERGNLRSEILRMIQEDRKCEEQMAWKWLHQACSALELVHSKKVIHRDIKPENILLRGDNSPNIKIADFGISRILVSEEQRLISNSCTPRYAAPDVASPGGYDYCVDMWGIGVVFFELLTRGILVDREDMKHRRVVRSKLNPENLNHAYFWSRSLKNPKFVAECKQSIIDNGYSNELAELVSNLMERDPNKRRTAPEIVKFIEEKFGKLRNSLSMKNFEIRFKDLNLIKKIGDGGFGVVWLAKWNGRGSGMPVAVKKLLFSDSEDQQSQSAGAGSSIQLSGAGRREFENEMEVMFSLGFPHVVRIFGACIDPTGPLCIVEEFAERGSLFDILHNESIELEWWLRWRMAKQAAMGLNYLHNCNPAILHRDIKSMNFLVNKHWNIKICDFGLAKVRLESSTQSNSLSSSNSQSKPVGTVRWSAPESLDHPPMWSTKSDVYSLGMTMWEITSRQIPFKDVGEDAAILMLVCFRKIRPEIPSECPAPLSKLIQQCWSADPKDRPSCEQILDMMSEFDNQFPEQDNLPNPIQQTSSNEKSSFSPHHQENDTPKSIVSNQNQSQIQVINGFEVIKELEAGRYGKVHLVHQQNTSPIKQFAMKVIPCDPDVNRLNKILKEIMSFAKFAHPAIVQVEQCFSANLPTKLGSNKGNETLASHACIVMEYCERGDLRSEILRMIQENRKCEVRVAWKWLRQACSALELIHSNKMIHRDIKPDNILLSGDNPPNIKIADCEASRTLEKDQDLAKTQIGTLRYVAPEIPNGERYGQGVDMWGIGVVFFELLTRGILVKREDMEKGRVDRTNLKPENKNDEPFWSRALKNPNFVSECKQEIIDNGYLNELAGLVSNLMEPDPNKRRTARDVVNLIDENAKKTKISFPSQSDPASNALPKQQLQVINGYEVIKELGAGAFGKVYLVHRQNATSPIKQFAMKVIPCGNDVTKLSKILNQVLLAKQHHPSIVKVEAGFTAEISSKLERTSGPEVTQPHACIVMEYCERGNLRSEILRMIQENRKCEEQVVWKWLHQACSALELIHSKHMIHRDIKPQNLLLSGDNPPNIKITDFGIARRLMRDTDLATTQIEEPRRYIAPELATGSGFGMSVDMWGIGVVFFELLTRGIFILKKTGSRIQDPNEIPFWERIKKTSFFFSSRQSINDNGYSQEIAEVVCNLMEPDPNKRRTAGNVLKLIETKFNSDFLPKPTQSRLEPSGSAPAVPIRHLMKKNYEIDFKDLKLHLPLGEGGFGIVYEGKWQGKGGGMRVAVKILIFAEIASPTSQLSSAYRQDFDSEMEIMFSLSHEHVIRIYGACINPLEPLCIVEEFAERGSLFDVLHKDSIEMSWGMKWRMARQATLGLNYLHNCKPVILHRDLKSLNLLVNKDWNIKICDFGLAKMRLEISSTLESKSSDQSENMVGSLRWNAPETMAQRPLFSTKSDVYSLGMTMWEITSRRLPFEDVRDNFSIPILVKEGARPQIPSDCLMALSKLIQQCWNQDPDVRPSCQQILEEMSNHEFRDDALAAPGMTNESKSRSISPSGCHHENSSASLTRTEQHAPSHIFDSRPKFRVLIDFFAETSMELTIREGDIVRVIDQDASGWWKGELNGQIGSFPGNFVDGPI